MERERDRRKDERAVHPLKEKTLLLACQVSLIWPILPPERFWVQETPAEEGLVPLGTLPSSDPEEDCVSKS